MKNQATPAKRRKARHFGVQALYQWQVNGAALNTIEAEFHADNDMTHTDTQYFHELVHEIPAKASALDEMFRPLLQGRQLDELDFITLALLRLATYELHYRLDIPYRVVINEAISLARKFGAVDSYKFVNGVLDKLVVKLRQVEVRADKQANGRQHDSPSAS